MLHSLKTHGLYDAYHFPGCTTRRSAQGIFGDAHAVVLTLIRRGKKPRAAPAVISAARSTTAGCDMSVIWLARTGASSFSYRFVGSPVLPAKP